MDALLNSDISITLISIILQSTTLQQQTTRTTFLNRFQSQSESKPVPCQCVFSNNNANRNLAATTLDSVWYDTAESRQSCAHLACVVLVNVAPQDQCILWLHKMCLCWCTFTLTVALLLLSQSFFFFYIVFSIVTVLVVESPCFNCIYTQVFLI